MDRESSSDVGPRLFGRVPPTCNFSLQPTLMPSMSETHEFIVVNDGSSRVGAHNERSVSSPASASSPFGDGEDGSQRRKSGRPGDSLDKLRALPKVREIPFYEGKELPADRSTESTRVQTRGACLLASRGEVQTPPCTHCASGVGRFSQCIALDDWFHGACATCQLATRGNLCSLRNRDTLRMYILLDPSHHILTLNRNKTGRSLEIGRIGDLQLDSSTISSGGTTRILTKSYFRTTK